MLRPSKFNLRTVVRKIVEKPELAFGVYPQGIYLRGVDGTKSWPKIEHLSMSGPARCYTSGRAEDYKGPIWVSKIDLFSLETPEEAIERLIGLLGNPSHIKNRIYKERMLETSLRYDFPIEKQPKQSDPSPHLVHFRFDRTGQRKEFVEREGFLQFGEIGGLADRVYTPRKYFHWMDNAKVVEAARKKLTV